MISIHIGGNEKQLNDVTDDWIIQQIKKRKRNGQNVCVEIVIDTDEINIALTTPGCPKGRYSSRKINRDEKKIFDMWDSFGLKNYNFNPMNVAAFIKQLRGMF